MKAYTYNNQKFLIIDEHDEYYYIFIMYEDGDRDVKFIDVEAVDDNPLMKEISCEEILNEYISFIAKNLLLDFNIGSLEI